MATSLVGFLRISLPARCRNILRKLSCQDDGQGVWPSGTLDPEWNSALRNGRLTDMKAITANDLLGLPVEERLRLVEDLWDSIAEVPEAVELSDDQRKELDERLEQFHHDPEAGSPWKDVRDRILKRK